MTITISENVLWFIGGGVVFVGGLYLVGYLWAKANLG